MYTIGTAGHVDHGKSSLVKALTGIDPDRLIEEQERGMTIDLGFAWLRLPSGRGVSIVDVPGHERFIKNMLAGVGGIDMALLVVAADEGTMPQTTEHLAILDLLRIRSGVVAVTKTDLVDDDWLQLVLQDVSERIAGTSLGSSPIVAVSAVTGAGMDELRGSIDRQLDSVAERQATGQPRLPVDRSFTIAGFGTVVTGTLLDGELAAGQELEIQPRGTRTRARGLQVHKSKVERAEPGSRVAVNLASVARGEVERGDVLTTPGWLRPTQAFDAELQLLCTVAKELRHGATVHLYTGSAEAIAKVALLDRQALAPGDRGWVQFHTDKPLALCKGDLFVIRSPIDTLGGGEILDVHPRRHRRFQQELLTSLAVLQKGSPDEVLLQSLVGTAPLSAESAGQRAGLSADVTAAALASLVERGDIERVGADYIASASWASLVGRLESCLASHHAQYPYRSGMPKEELKSRLQQSSKVFNQVVLKAAAQGAIVEDRAAGRIRLAAHQVQFGANVSERVEVLKRTLAAAGFSPPTRRDVEAALGLDTEVIEALVERGDLVKVGDSLVIARQSYDEILSRVRTYISERGTITVAEVRDLLATSRKYALALLEHLDEVKLTRRIGDERVLR